MSFVASTDYNDASFNDIIGNKIDSVNKSKNMAYDLYALTPNEFKQGSNTTVTDINAPLSTTSDAAQEDINTLLLQQNTLYTMGVLTAATFLITAILLAK
jgi:hypothetical protein